MARNFANASSEVLVYGFIPKRAMMVLEKVERFKETVIQQEQKEESRSCYTCSKYA